MRGCLYVCLSVFLHASVPLSGETHLIWLPEQPVLASEARCLIKVRCIQRRREQTSRKLRAERQASLSPFSLSFISPSPSMGGEGHRVREGGRKEKRAKSIEREK